MRSGIAFAVWAHHSIPVVACMCAAALRTLCPSGATLPVATPAEGLPAVQALLDVYACSLRFTNGTVHGLFPFFWTLIHVSPQQGSSARV